MSTGTTYDNSGAISRNERKEKDTQPDQTGSAMIGGVEYWVNGWVNERKDGTGRFLSLKFRPKEEAPVGNQPAPSSYKMDDDIPF